MRLTTGGVALIGIGTTALVGVVAPTLNARVSRKDREHGASENQLSRQLAERTAGRPERAALYLDLMELLGQVEEMTGILERTRRMGPDGAIDFGDPWEGWPAIADRTRLHASADVFGKLQMLSVTWHEVLDYCRGRWQDMPSYQDKQAVIDWVAATGRTGAAELDVQDRLQYVLSLITGLRETLRAELHPGD